MVVQGTIRMLQLCDVNDDSLRVRAIQAEVQDSVAHGAVGWELDDRGCGIGRHYSDRFQDPSMVKPDMPGRFFRTTLVQGRDSKWYVLELCEQLDGLVQLDAEFHEMHGRRNVITFVTDSEKDPMVLGFTLVDEQPERFPVQADDDDVDIPDESMQVQGAEIPEGRVAIQPTAEDEVNVNGTILRESSSLAALRAGCSFYSLSTSGSKSKCFKRLVEHSKKLELDMVMAAAREAVNQQERSPLAPVSVEVPSEWEQSQHRLTHLPFKSWCPSCLAHRARSDKHERSGESHSGPVPTISFDFFFTKSDGKDAKGDEPNKITSLIVVDSHTSFVACVPLEGKAQLDHANREVIKFVQMLGWIQ